MHHQQIEKALQYVGRVVDREMGQGGAPGRGGHVHVQVRPGNRPAAQLQESAPRVLVPIRVIEGRRRQRRFGVDVEVGIVVDPVDVGGEVDPEDADRGAVRVQPAG